jgi:phosphatidate cytidylyltransferase
MLTRIIVAVVLAPLFFWVLLAPPTLCLALLMSAICALASYELLKATQVAHHNLMYVFTALAAVIVPLGYWSGYGSLVTRAVALVLMSALFFVAILRYDEEKPLGLEQVMVCMFGGLLIPMFLSSLIVLRGMEHGRWLVLLPVICAFLTDAGAYFAGVFLGRHRGITRVSPNKSLEGYIGGILSGAVFLLLYGLALQRFVGLTVSLPILALYGLLGSAVTELGDLSFSLIKRQYGIKDYGHLLPGHGGMLDRFDSMTFAAPMLLLLVEIIPAF